MEGVPLLAMPIGFYEAEPRHFSRLSTDEGARFLKRLLHAEATCLGIPISKVNMTLRLTVSDGGVDADIQDAEVSGDLIFPGHTAYQVKSGDFSPWQPAVARDELLSKDGSVKPAVKKVLDLGGTYVLVCMGVDFISDNRTIANAHIVDVLESKGHASPSVVVLGQGQLIEYVHKYPSLLCDLLQRHLEPTIEWFGLWASVGEMRSALHPGEGRLERTKQLESDIREGREHIRVLGEAGIGKTRTVLEALKADDLSPLVLYSSKPLDVLRSRLLRDLRAEDSNRGAILVVDDCPRSLSVDIWAKVADLAPRVRLVTIYNDVEEQSATTALVDVAALPDDEIRKIIEDYYVSEDIDYYVQFCSRSPRAAHLVGNALKHHPKELLRASGTSNIWLRFLARPDEAIDSEAVKRRRTVLMYLALFRRFGFVGPVAEDSKVIWSLMQENDEGIPLQRFRDVVEELRSMKVLQGEHTLFISPKILHLKMYLDWWSRYGNEFEFGTLRPKLGKDLFQWFSEMFEYAKSSGAASTSLRKILESDVFARGIKSLEDEELARFFFAMSRADPESTLRYLEDVIGTASVEDLKAFHSGRRWVVYALEGMAVWRELFTRSALVLARLAEAENETWSNNATGVFASLFSLGRGRVAPTEASPSERFGVLSQVLESKSVEMRSVGLKACDRSLEIAHMTRTAGAEYQGLREPPKLWSPATWEEVWGACRATWGTLRDHLRTLPDAQRTEGVKILVTHAREFVRHTPLNDVVVETMREFHEKGWLSSLELAELAERIIRHDLPTDQADSRAPWEGFLAELVGDDLHSQLQRYIGMDLYQDRLDDGEQGTDRMDSLADRALREQEGFERELHWLMTDAAKNGYRFGVALGRKNQDFSLLPKLVEAQRNAGEGRSDYFLGGYLRPLAESDSERWEEVLDQFAADPKMRGYVPTLTWRSGMTDRAARRVLTLVREGHAAPAALSVFAYGGVVDSLSSEPLNEWLWLLLSQRDRRSAEIAVDLYFFYYGFKRKESRKPPSDLTLALLNHDAFFAPPEMHDVGRVEFHTWTLIALRWLENDPEESLSLAERMLEFFGAEGTPMGGFRPEAAKVLSKILELRPVEVWAMLAQALEPPTGSRGYLIRDWLKDDRALNLIPANLIWEWIDEDPDKRGWEIALSVAKEFPGAADKCSARELLVRYGDLKSVRTNLWANFATESFTGDESSHQEGKLSWLRSLRDNEVGELGGNPRVLKWLDDYIATTESSILDARIREEREY